MPDSGEKEKCICGGIADFASLAVTLGGSEMELERANWQPLELLIGSRCGEFMWMWRENGFEHYKHIDSRRYLILDAEGRCYRQQRDQLVRVDFQDEFRRVTEAIGV